MTSQRIKRPNRTLVVVAVAGMVLLSAGAVFLLVRSRQAKYTLADYIRTHPDSTAVVVYSVDSNGEPVEQNDAILLNADTPLILASTVKIVVLAAYADAVAAGELDPNEEVTVADWEKYHVPFTDAGAHAKGLRSLGLKADGHGFARDPAATVTLADLARLMIHHSGNAATDYLIVRLGPERMSAVLREMRLHEHSPIDLLLGSTLLAVNHEDPTYDLEKLRAVVSSARSGDTSALDDLAELYLHDEAWRRAQIEHMDLVRQATPADMQAVWDFQSEVARTLPAGTATDYARTLAAISSGRLLSDGASAIMRELLESVPSDWPLRLLFHDVHGAKDGVTAGVLTIASYSTPKRGPLAGQTRVVVILVNGLPLQEWSTQMAYSGLYLLQTDLARATGAYGELVGTSTSE